MFSKELESVIEAALADGVLTDKERAVLHRRAAEEGVDPDELDVVIEGRLAKMKREEDWLRPAPPSDKFGEVKKCPRCGEPVEPMAVKCSACGYEFRNVEANNSSQRLADKLEKIREFYRDKISKLDRKNVDKDGDVIGEYGLKKDRDKEIVRTIQSFPIPTTREDLIEFITSMRAKWRNASDAEADDGSKAAYRAKYVECMSKAKILFADDPQFQVLFDQEIKDNTLLGKFAALSSFGKMGVILAVATVIMMIFSFIGAFLSSH